MSNNPQNANQASSNVKNSQNQQPSKPIIAGDSSAKPAPVAAKPVAPTAAKPADYTKK